MQTTSGTTPGSPNQEQEKLISPFEEIKDMNLIKATNILLSSANAAQRAGALSVRDSVLIASAGEFLSTYVNSLTQKSVTSDEN